MTSQWDCRTIFDVDDDLLVSTTGGDARHWPRQREISFLGEFLAILQKVDKEPSSNDPFPEADVAAIIMNRFVTKPVARRTKHQLIGEPIPPPSNAFDHQKWEKAQGLPRVWDQSPIPYDRTNNAACLPPPTGSSFGLTTRDQEHYYGICALDNLNSGIAVRG